MSESKKPVIHTTVSPKEFEEMAKILDGLVGTPLARTGDIAIEDHQNRYVITKHEGAEGVIVDRSSGKEVPE